MTVKKRVVSEETRRKLSASWAAKRKAKTLDESRIDPAPEIPIKQPRVDAGVITTFDRTTASNHAMAISRAINHLTDYQRKLELDGYIGHPAEIERTILHLGDIGRLFRGE